MDRIRTIRVAHVSSTFHAGGVTEILTPPSLMMDAIGIDWHDAKRWLSRMTPSLQYSFRS
jgi:hypothetical protein